MVKGDFQISLSKVFLQYILFDFRSFEQVVCVERDGMENFFVRGILRWLELEKFSLGFKLGVLVLVFVYVRYGWREEGWGS